MKCYACGKSIDALTKMAHHPDIGNAVVFYCEDCWNRVKEKTKKTERIPCFSCGKVIIPDRCRHYAVEAYGNGTMYVMMCGRCHRNEMIRSICSKVQYMIGWLTSWRLEHVNIRSLMRIDYVTDRFVRRFPGASLGISIGRRITRIQYPEHLDKRDVENVVTNAETEWIKKNT